MMTSDADRKVIKEGKDPLEASLEEMSWFAKQQKKVAGTIAKTRETFGEEVGNSITSGVLALYILFMIPFGAVHAYTHAPEGMAVTDSLGVSAFLLFAFLANLFTTIYHFLKPGSIHKRVFLKLDHIMVYYAIFGVYAPVCLSVIGGGRGIGILIAELALALLGTFLMIFMYPLNKTGSKFAAAIYGVMALLIIFAVKPFYLNSTKASFWLLVSGAFVYLFGLFFYSGKKFKFSHMVWHLMVVIAEVCHVLALVYFFR